MRLIGGFRKSSRRPGLRKHRYWSSPRIEPGCCQFGRTQCLRTNNAWRNSGPNRVRLLFSRAWLGNIDRLRESDWGHRETRHPCEHHCVGAGGSRRNCGRSRSDARTGGASGFDVDGLLHRRSRWRRLGIYFELVRNRPEFPGARLCTTNTEWESGTGRSWWFPGWL